MSDPQEEELDFSKPMIGYHLDNVNEVYWKNPDDSLKNRTISMINLMGIIGMKEIKHDNAIEVFLRIRLQESVNGPMILTPEGEPLYTMMLDVIQHIGLLVDDVVSAPTMDYWRMHINNLADTLLEYTTDQLKAPEEEPAPKILIPDDTIRTASAQLLEP